MTPSQTPSRANSKDRSTMVPMTAEKEKAPTDQAVLHAKEQQVLEELSRIDGFADIAQKGLKNMTTKQFAMILQHFVKLITGSVSFDVNNYIDYIYDFVQSLDYPYSINKSLLKTPLAPHCHNGTILLLSWFTEFSLKEDDMAPLFHFSPTDELETPEIATTFMEQTAEAFYHWNNQQEAEADHVSNQIKQMYIEKRTGKREDLDVAIHSLKVSVDQLKKEAKKPVSLQKEYNEKQEEYKRLIDRNNGLCRTITSLTDRIANLKVTMDSKQANEAHVKSELQALRQKMNNQKMTVEEKEKILVEISQDKIVLENRKEAAMQLIESSRDNEIKLSNLIQKKFYLIDKLNNHIYKLSCDLQIAGMKEKKFDPNQYAIKTNKIDDADKLDGELEHLRQGLVVLKTDYMQAMGAFIQTTNQLNAEKMELTQELKLLMEDEEKLASSLTQVDTEVRKLNEGLLQLVRSMNERSLKMATTIKQHTADVKILQENIAIYNEVNAQLKAHKSEFKKHSLEQCKALNEQRKQEAEEARKKLSEMKQVIAEFRKRQQQPFPENVQSVIDEVMAKKK